MGAEIPRYNLEKLPSVSIQASNYESRAVAYPSFLIIFLKQSTMPL